MSKDLTPMYITYCCRPTFNGRRLTAPWVVLMMGLLMAAGCSDDPDPETDEVGLEGLTVANPSGGAAIEFDEEYDQFPNAPFPNDAFTRPSSSSPTGLRLDLAGPTSGYAEARVRGALNEASGFGVYAPITLSFDAPLDVESIIERHHHDTPDFSDDVVYLVDVDPDSPHFGQFHLLDMGLGNYPLTLSDIEAYFDNDPKADGTNLLFPTEPHHGGEPNLRTEGGDPLAFGELLDFYERETNTLIMRPVRPLESGTTYAVVITDELADEEGLAIDSPFEWINDPEQTEALEPLRDILPDAFPERFDSDLAGVRFTWSFTTGTPEEFLKQVRRGLYGQGPMSELHDLFPPRIHTLHDVKGTGEDPLTFSLEPVFDMVFSLAASELGDDAADALEETIGDIDYMVSGTFLSPSFLGNDDGICLATNFDERSFNVDTPRGTKRVQPVEVPFTCAVPKNLGQTQAPFPVVIYSHAIGSTRFELLAFAGTLAKFGFATCALASPGHGVPLPSEFRPLLENLAQIHSLHNLPDLLEIHRARDLTNDGDSDSGGDYFTADMLWSRKMIQQTTIDQMQLIRILRSFDGTRRFAEPEEAFEHRSPYAHIDAGWDQSGDGNPEIAGDFTGDGVVDFGGDREYVTMGTSLGGIQSAILAGADPSVVAGVSNAGGGGLTDIAVRSTNSNVQSSVMLRAMGLLLVGHPVDDGEMTRMRWLVPDDTGVRRVHFVDLPALEDGQRVVVRNLRRESIDALSDEDARAEDIVTGGAFRVGIAADAIHPATRRFELGFDPSLDPWDDYEPDQIPDELPAEEFKDYQRRIVDDPTRYGDPLVIEIYDEQDELIHQIDTFPTDTVDAGILYPEGASLAALSEGWGLERQTPEFRRFLEFGQILLEPVDPVVWARDYAPQRRHFPFGVNSSAGHTNYLVIGTLGDQVVPINTAIAIARASGAVNILEAHPDYGKPENQMLIDEFVYEGISHLDRFADFPNTLFDPDDLDEGLWRPDGLFEEPGPIKPAASPPLRASWQTDDGLQALRLGYLDRTGEHTFNLPEPSSPFDAPAFLANQSGWFLATGGQQISDDHCQQELAMTGCGFFTAESFENPL